MSSSQREPPTTRSTARSSLLVQEQGQSRTIPLADEAVTLGRAPDNTVVLASRFVSSHHARIEPEGPAHVIIDTHSANGLLFQGRRIPGHHSLRDGDVLRIGDAAAGSFVTLVYHNRSATRPARSSTVHSYPLDPHDPAITIGRSGCEVTLDSPQVSRFHAWLGRAPDGSHILRDVGSTNGTFVNGQRITEHTLTPGDIIQIGAFRLVYQPTSLTRYDQQGEQRLAVHGIAYDVGQGQQTRRILHELSLAIEPREFVALVGGSGAGKSTLLKALSGYEPASSGQVLVNGDDFYSNFDVYRPLLGYLPQDEVLHQSLTVQQALLYSACLRLPADTSAEEVARRIGQVLEEVEMSDQRHTRILHLSGGQRKRVGIAAELLSNPSLFFLDEPTSGLDPGLERKMMYTLRRLSDSGRTVVVVTHATENILQCDHVALLAHGLLVYFGPPAQALGFFGISSGDFADVYTRLEGEASPDSRAIQGELGAEYAAWRAAHPESPTPPLLAELWQAKYRASDDYQRYVADRLARMPAAPALARSEPSGSQTPRRSALQQFPILLQRSLRLLRQEQSSLALLLLQTPVVALLLHLVTAQDALLGVQTPGLIQRGEALRVLFMLTLVSIWFGIINATREITREAVIFRHERMVNLRLGAYLTSKVALLALLLLLQVGMLLLVLGGSLRYPLWQGLLLPVPLELAITMLLAALAGSALGLVISAAATTPERAIGIIPLAMIMQIVFSGQVFPIQGAFNEAISQVTISRWALDAAGSSLHLATFCDLPNVSAQGSGRPPLACNLGMLQRRAAAPFPDAFTHTAEHLLLTWGVLLAYSAVCIGIAAWLLARHNRGSRPSRALAWWRVAGWLRLPRRAALAAAVPAAPQADTAADIGQANDTIRAAAQPDGTLLLDSTPPPDDDQDGQHGQDSTLLLDSTPPTDDDAPPATAEDSSADHSRIDRYHIEEELGRRGTFIVYRAYDPYMKRQVAIKVLQPEFCTDTARQRFQQEVNLIAGLEHPCIVRVYDYGEVSDQPFIVMRCLSGGALAARLENGPLRLRELVPIVTRVAEALDEAHSQGILHQNLKPANILFDEQGQAFLSDFGINVSSIHTDILSDLSTRGIFDANYLSPEQVRALLQRPAAIPAARLLAEETSLHSDIYALGAIVFHALSGQPPYRATMPQATALGHVRLRVPTITALNAELPAQCQALIERVLAKRPDRRYASAGEFAQALQQLASGRWALRQLLPAGQGGAPAPARSTAPAAPHRTAQADPPVFPAYARRIGRYVLKHELGRGGMGIVYLVHDPATRRQVALKALPHQLSLLPGFAARFRREAEVVAALEHECIVPIYDLGEHQRQPFIVMQYMTGGTLAARLARGMLPHSQIARIIERIALALEAAHRQQIIHQDIKPANILFDEREQAYLSDFGIAVVKEAATGSASTVGGTPGYMSPEQAHLLLEPAASTAASTAALSERSDVYSLGVVLFHALTGHLPYQGKSDAELARAHLTVPVPRLQALKPAVPPAYQEIIDRALAKDPARRYASARDLARDVGDIVSGKWYLRRL